MLEKTKKIFSGKKGKKLEIIGSPHFILFLIFGGLVLVLTVSFFYASFFIKQNEENILNIQASQGKRISYVIESFVHQKTENLEQIAKFLTKINKESEKSEETLQGFIEKYPEIKFLSVFDVSGKEIKRIINPEKGFTERGLSSSKTFNKAMNKEVSVSEVLFSEIDEPYVRIGVPIFNEKEKIMEGVLLGGLSLKKVCEIITEIVPEKTDRLLLVDEKGNLIASSDPQIKKERVNLLNLTPVRSTVLGKEFKNVSKGGEYFNEKKELVIGIGVPVENFGWGVIIEQNSREFRKVEKDVHFLIFLSTFLSFTFVLVLSWNIIRLINANTTILRYQQRLEESKEKLEIKVHERTKELEEKMKDLEKFRRVTIDREMDMIALKKETQEIKKELEKYKK